MKHSWQVWQKGVWENSYQYIWWEWIVSLVSSHQQYLWQEYECAIISIPSAYTSLSAMIRCDAAAWLVPFTGSAEEMWLQNGPYWTLNAGLLTFRPAMLFTTVVSSVFFNTPAVTLDPTVQHYVKIYLMKKIFVEIQRHFFVRFGEFMLLSGCKMASNIICFMLSCFGWNHLLNILMMFPLFQFQLVADLFQDTNKDGSSSTSSSSKSSRINVRSAKPTPKVPNKEHRKTVGHQVSIPSDTEAWVQSTCLWAGVCLCRCHSAFLECIEPFNRKQWHNKSVFWKCFGGARTFSIVDV